MPELTKKSAVCSISSAETLQPKAFQSLKPIGGVLARPLSSATAGAGEITVKIDAALNPTASASPTALSKATNRRRPVPFPPCCIAIVPFRFAQDRSHSNMYRCLRSTVSTTSQPELTDKHEPHIR